MKGKEGAKRIRGVIVRHGKRARFRHRSCKIIRINNEDGC